MGFKKKNVFVNKFLFIFYFYCNFNFNCKRKTYFRGNKMSVCASDVTRHIMNEKKYNYVTLFTVN